MASAAENYLLIWKEELRQQRRALLREARQLRQVESKVSMLLSFLGEDKIDETTTPPAAVEEPTPAPPPEDPILFTVNSATQSGLVHKIREGKNGPYCDCTAASYGNHCWHLGRFEGSDKGRAYKYHKYAAPSLSVSPDAKPTETFYTSVPGGR